jgi:hypothetical protein
MPGVASLRGFDIERPLNYSGTGAVLPRLLN